MAIDINYVRVFIIQIYLQPKRDTGTNFTCNDKPWLIFEVHVGEFIPNSRGGISFVTSKTRCSSTVGKGKGSQYGNHIGRSLAGASLMTMARQSERFQVYFRSKCYYRWVTTGSMFWIYVRLRNQVRTRWTNQFLVRIYKWIIQVWSIRCTQTRKQLNVETLPNHMRTHWCLSMKIQRFTLVIANDQGPVQTGFYAA